MWPYFSIVPLIFQRLCDDYHCLILVLSAIFLDSWGYIGWGPPSGYLKSFLLSFLFFLFFFFLLFFFCFLYFHFLLSLGGGGLKLWGPGHCPPMPPSRYATGRGYNVQDEFEKSANLNIWVVPNYRNCLQKTELSYNLASCDL